MRPASSWPAVVRLVKKTRCGLGAAPQGTFLPRVLRNIAGVVGSDGAHGERGQGPLVVMEGRAYGSVWGCSGIGDGDQH